MIQINDVFSTITWSLIGKGELILLYMFSVSFYCIGDKLQKWAQFQKIEQDGKEAATRDVAV